MAKSKMVNVRLADNLVKKIEEARSTSGIGLSEFIRAAIIEKLRTSDAVDEIRTLISEQNLLHKGLSEGQRDTVDRLDRIIELLEKGR